MTHFSSIPTGTRAVSLGVSLLVLSTLAGNFTPAAASTPVAPPRQSGQSLQLPDSAFSPGTPNGGAVLDNSNPNITDTGQWPRLLHSVTYESLGRQTGYIEGAYWQPSGATDNLGWIYAASVFATEDGAKTAWQDGSTFYPSQHPGVSTTDCASSMGTPCTRLTVLNTVVFDLIQFNQCLAETYVTEFSNNGAGASTTDHLMQTQQAQALATLTNVDVAALAAMKAVCLPPPDFTLLAARFEPSGGSYDINSPALTTATVGRTVALAAYLAVRRGPATCPSVLTFDVTRDGSPVNHQVLSLANCLSTTPVRYAVNQKLDGPGTYTLTITATVQDVSQHQTASLTVTRPAKVKKPGKPSYSFDGLTTLNASRHQQSAFRAREQGFLTIAWTAKHLNSKQQTEIQITYQAMSRGHWRTIASPLPITVSTTNGSNSYQISFYTPQSYSAMRFTVALYLLGRWSQHRSATITIRK